MTIRMVEATPKRIPVTEQTLLDNKGLVLFPRMQVLRYPATTNLLKTRISIERLQSICVRVCTETLCTTEKRSKCLLAVALKDINHLYRMEGW